MPPIGCLHVPTARAPSPSQSWHAHPDEEKADSGILAVHDVVYRQTDAHPQGLQNQVTHCLTMIIFPKMYHFLRLAIIQEVEMRIRLSCVTDSG